MGKQRKHLAIRVRKNADGELYGYITDQTHRGRKFGDNAKYFTHGLFRLTSASYTAYFEDLYSTEFCGITLFVLGANRKLDEKKFYIPSIEYLKRMRAAVKAYNQYYKD